MTFLQGFTTVVFYIFAVSAIAASLVVVTTRNPVKGVLFLVLAFVATAAVWIFLHAEFLALILVVVYVGAVMTLFLFVVMMLNIDVAQKRTPWVKLLPVGLIVIFLVLIMMIFVVGPQHYGASHVMVPGAVSANYSNVKALGDTLYGEFVFPFEVAGVLLLTAMIAAITLSFRGPRNRKVVRVPDQLAAKRNDRLRIVKMKSEKREG